MFKYYSNGKLLLTSEYVVLDGAVALAIPTKYGQFLEAKSIEERIIKWRSYTNEGKLWLSCEFSLPDLKIISGDKELAVAKNSIKKLQKILLEVKKLNPEFLSHSKGFSIQTNLTFPINWGLGSSSTLINNLANWAMVDPFELQFNTFGGSAYDIACAQNKKPILYQLHNKKPVIKSIEFSPYFLDQLYFIHLNKKQDSREGIAQYQKNKDKNRSSVNELTQLTKEIVQLKNLIDFEKILIEHERIIASIIKEKPIKKVLFNDYFGEIKSLGAWGGDFILATGNDDTIGYFKDKGFTTVVKYKDMIL